MSMRGLGPALIGSASANGSLGVDPFALAIAGVIVRIKNVRRRSLVARGPREEDGRGNRAAELFETICE